MLEPLTYVADEAATVCATRLRNRAEKLPRRRDRRLRRQLEKLAGDLASLPRHAGGHRRGGLAVGRGAAPREAGPVYGGINGYEGRPTKSQLDQLRVLGARLDKAGRAPAVARHGELPAVNQGLTARKLEPVALLTFEEWKKK